MENWITRIVATLCATGSTALFWMLGVFIAAPWRAGRMLELNWIELQLIGIPLLIGLAVTWGALHIFAIADRAVNPRIYATTCIVLVIASAAAVIGGIAWTPAHIT